MREYDENAMYDDDSEDEESISAESCDDVFEEIGELSFRMEKSEAIDLVFKLFLSPGEMKSLTGIENQLANHSVYHGLTHDNIKEILEYAAEQNIIKFENDFYVRVD